MEINAMESVDFSKIVGSSLVSTKPFVSRLTSLFLMLQSPLLMGSFVIWFDLPFVFYFALVFLQCVGFGIFMFIRTTFGSDYIYNRVDVREHALLFRKHTNAKFESKSKIVKIDSIQQVYRNRISGDLIFGNKYGVFEFHCANKETVFLHDDIENYLLFEQYLISKGKLINS